jgi:hypothetical protein
VCRKVLPCSGGSSTGGIASDGDSSSHSDSGSGSGSGRSGKNSHQPHTCPHPCHAGPCPPCAIPAVLSCRCGRAVNRTHGKCGDRDAFTCAKACGRKLACGVHYCTVVCHAGECPPCAELAKRRTCPCGKQSRIPLASAAVPSCADLAFQAVSCGDTCDKPLVGCAHRHTCQQKCHTGACAPCQVPSSEYIYRESGVGPLRKQCKEGGGEI